MTFMGSAQMPVVHVIDGATTATKRAELNLLVFNY